MARSARRRTGARISAAAVVMVVVTASSMATTEARAPTPEARIDASQAISTSPAYVPPCVLSPFAAGNPEAEFQPQIVADPFQPDHLTVVWTQGLIISALVATRSGPGAAWVQHHAPLTRCDPDGADAFAGDATVGFGPDGALYLMAITGDDPVQDSEFLSPAGGPGRIVMSRSTDDGQTWSPVSVVVNDGRHPDRPAFAVDPHNPRRLWAVWTDASNFVDDTGTSIRRDELRVASSDDAAATWTAPQTVYRPPGPWDSPPTPAQSAIPAALSVLPDGTLLCAFEQENKSAADATQEMALRSVDGGATWSTSLIANTFGFWPTDPDTDSTHTTNEVIGNAEPALVVDREGVAWAAWQDVEPPGNGKLSTISAAKSTDGGVTWSTPRLVSATTGQRWLPTLAVDEYGTAAITWYDTRADQPGDGQWTTEVRVGVSRDGGQTWSDQRLAGPFDLHTALNEPPAEFALGNYMGLTETPGGFGAAFAMSEPQNVEPTGTQDIFFNYFCVPSAPHGCD